MFSWQTPKRRGSSVSANRRTEVIVSDLQSRAATLYRLGFSPEAAADRLDARIAWEHEPRPAGLDRAAIGKLVTDVYARRPS